MNVLKKFKLTNLSIKFKFIIGIVLILILAMLSLSIVFIKQSENLLIEALKDKADLLNSNFSIVAAKSIDENTFSNLQVLINEVAIKDDEIKVLLVTAPNGMIIATSDLLNFRQFSKIKEENILQQIKTQQSTIVLNKSKGILESILPIYNQQIDDEIDDFFDEDDIAINAKISPISNSTDEESLVGFIYIALDTIHLQQTITSLWLYSSLLACFIMGLGILVAYGFGHSMSKPIAILAHEVHVITSGDLSNPIISSSGDELGRLMSDVEKMRLSIKDLTENLEAKVNERTMQLASANEEITILNDRLQAENLRLGAELDVARQLQQMVLPKEQELRQIKNLDISGFMEPADEVGGDYYDVLEHEGSIKIGIGDVTGHGLESGVLMLMVQTAVRSLLISGITDATKFLTILNQIIYDNVQRIGTSKNLTLSLLDYKDGKVRLTGQHEDVLLVRKNSEVEQIDTLELGFSVGLMKDITKFVGQKEFVLQPGDGIVLYTDGITEAMNLDMDAYGLENLSVAVSKNWHKTSTEIQQSVIEDVREFIGTQKVYDDITLLILKQK
ncbi:MAG: SpoIIE family protein phosphatase [Candidatus Marithrix sp.]